MRFLKPQPILTFLRGKALVLISLIVLFLDCTFLESLMITRPRLPYFLFSSIRYVLEQSLSNGEGIEMITSTELHLQP